MAKAKAGPIVTAISGSIGGVTFRGGGSNVNVSAKARKVGWLSLSEQAEKDRLASWSSEWAGMSAAERGRWENLGKMSSSSGWEVFLLSKRWETISAGAAAWPGIVVSELGAVNALGIVPEIGMTFAWSAASNGLFGRSSDGQNWEIFNSGFSSGWEAQAFSPSQWRIVAVASSGLWQVIFSDDDGETWTHGNAVDTSHWNNICYSPDLNLFLATAEAGTTCAMTSPDGETWTARTMAGMECPSTCVWMPNVGKFVALAQYGDHRFAYSSDGVNWVSFVPGSLIPWMSLAYSETQEKVVAVARDGVFRSMTSTNGISWTGTHIGTSHPWVHVAFSKQLEQWCATTDDGSGAVALSPDGVDWEIVETGRTGTAGNVIWSSMAAAWIVAFLSGPQSLALSGATVKPEDENGMPWCIGADDGFYPASAALRSLWLAPPQPSEWSFTVGGSVGSRTITISKNAGTMPAGPDIYPLPDSGAVQSWLVVSFGLPVSPTKKGYEGWFEPAGTVFMKIGTWEAKPLRWPWPCDISAGLRIPVKLRYISRGKRASPLSRTIIKLK